MKMILIIFAIGLAQIVTGQTSMEVQYAAYMKVSKSLWERSIRIADGDSGDNSFEKAVAMYGLLNGTMATQDEETFDDNVDQTIDLLKEIIENNPDWGEPKAVLSSVYGLVMAYSPMKGMIYGSKSSSLVETAMREQPDSPLVNKLFGGSKLYTPKMFGGSAEKAAEAFEKSIALYERDPNCKDNWMYLDTLVGLSLAYQKLEQEEKAKETLKKALKIEPEYGWAQSILVSMNQSK